VASILSMTKRPDLPLDYRNTNSLWCSVLVETLVRLGLKHAVVAPGSRSTPLTLALARHPAVEAIPVLDERSAAFFALGLARRTHVPVALVCTSGTAAANFLPAVVEAHESGTPLLVLTADRPPEMRECGSGQTIDQQKLYGAFVRSYHEMAVPAATMPMLRYARQTVRQAWQCALGPAPGPVHLNLPFRDPLPPIPEAAVAAFRGTFDEAAFFTVPAEARPAAPFPVMASDLPPAGGRGLIVAGPAQPEDAAGYAEDVAAIAQALRWPVLAEALTPLRNHAAGRPEFITTYDTFLRNRPLADRLRPDQVLVLGNWPTSKVVRDWLAGVDAPTWFVADGSANRDALHGRTLHLRTTVGALRKGLGHAAAGTDDWTAEWEQINERANREIDREVRQPRGWFEGRISRELPALLPKGAALFVANSMPVRDLEYFWPANDGGTAIHFNRGANGIDGTLSTAFGLAHGGRPTVLLTGDLSLLHDTNGFLQTQALRGSLTVLLVNNDGGGIFNHLPIAQFPEHFEKFFGTPQSVDFAALCRAYGVGHEVIKSWTQLGRLLGKLPERGVRVLEIRTDRARDAATRKALFARVAARLG